MTRYTAFDPDIELIGRTTLAFVQNINHADIEAILLRHHLNEIDPARWYRLQDVLDVLTDVSDNENGSENLVALGMAAGLIGLDQLPPELAQASVEQWFAAYGQVIYPGRHRNGFPGTVTFRKESDSHLVITTIIPYPDDLFYGLFFTYTRHFRKPGQLFSLKYDETASRHDRGGAETVYHILLD